MRTIVWAIVVLIIACLLILENRYEISVSSPIVAKMDRFTGEAWIVNQGEWRKVIHSTETAGKSPKVEAKNKTKRK